MKLHHLNTKTSRSYKQGKYVLLTLIFTFFTTACTTAPDTIIQNPLTAKPAARTKALASSGSIYQAQSYKALFEDRRARAIGDILTINITESTTAGKSGDGSSSKNSAMDTTATSRSFTFNLTSKSSMSNQDKSDSNASNNFNGSIGVTVIDVLENGNLLVSGEKQISFDRGSEFVRFSGVINPDFIKPGNYIISTQVADAKIEYRTGSHIDAAQITLFLQRCFLSFIPI